MPRNRSLLVFAGAAAALILAAALVCQFSPWPPGLVCALGGLGLFVLFLSYTLRRYQDIARLNTYLQRLTGGQPALDIRDNTEGELSILKNELYKVTAALTKQAAGLADDKRELANALADISHQLKTPLTALGVMADLLSEDSLSPERRHDFVENMRAGLHRMDWLVLSLLKLARLDAGAVALKREPAALSALTQRALSPLLIPIEVREQTVTVSGTDASVVCDLEWTCEALGNVLKNAVENTPAGGDIEIVYGENPLYAFVSVRSNGPEIDSADLPHLFKRFYRGKNAGRDSAGIGLSMSLAVMQKQNGVIDVEAGQGNTFILKFYRK